MAIATNNTITWTDLTSSVISAIKSVCCNVDGFASNIPADLKSGTASNPSVWSRTTSQGSNLGANHPNVWAQQTFSFYANNTTNLITSVTTASINTEWNNFLASAGADARSDKVIQANDFGKVMGLVTQFMGYHLKRVYSRRQIINGTVFYGVKYISGTCTPKYNLSGGIDPSDVPEVTNDDITALIRQNVVHDGVNYGVFDGENDPKLHRIFLN